MTATDSPLSLDSLDMWGATMGLPEQAEQALATAEEVLAGHDLSTWPAFSDVVVLGMGGSGVAGDVLQAVAGPRMAIPVTVVKSYELPASVGPGTLAFSVSCSGETEETVAATEAAFAAGAHVVVVTSGGTLGALAEERGALHVPVPPDLPQPRTALGAMALPPLVVLGHVGLLEPSEDLFGPVVSQLRRRRDELASGDRAARLARRIGRTIPLVHGGPGPGFVAARRWATQVNENAKSPAFAAAQPELCHNEVAGWGQHGDLTRQAITLVALRRPGDHPAVARRFAIVVDVLREVVADVVEVEAAGANDVAELFDLVLTGDVVSLHLAGQEGVDPGPVPILGTIKEALRSRA